MPKRSEEFLQRLQAAFAAEAREHCHALSSGLLQLEKASGAEQRPLVETIFRAAHSLKGAARAVNLANVEAICHRLENVFAAWKRQPAGAAAAGAFDTLHRAVDVLTTLVGPSNNPEQKRALQAAMPALLTDLARVADSAAATTAAAAHPAIAMLSSKPGGDATTAATTAIPPVAETSPGDETLRVSMGRMERVLYGAEELLTTKSSLAQRAADVRELNTLIERWRRGWTETENAVQALRLRATRATGAAQAGVRESQALQELIGESDNLGKAVQEKLAVLGRAIEQDRHDTGKLVDTLLDETKKLLLLPFSSDFAFFERLVRDLARQQGKEIEFVVRGGDVEIDKRILQEMKDPLVHLLRNCIDHGMERAEVRAQAGKPPRGTVTLTATPLDDHRVEIGVEDDGAGIDLDAVKRSAVRRGLISESASASLSEQQTLAFIFRSEISTAPIVTEISGRGVGLAIVNERVEKLGGEIRVSTERARGTAFRIVLPVAQATFRGVVVAISDQLFLVPAAKIDRVHRAAQEDIKTVGNRETITVDDRAVSLVWLADVLELPRRAARDAVASRFTETVVIGGADRRVAFAVDGIVSEEEVLVKPLRKPLVRVRNIASVTVLGSGRVVPILNISDLLKSASSAGARTTPTAIAKPPDRQRAILVAEDSITSRMLLKNILESAGYRVKTAVDGLDALTTLRAEQFDLVVSDVEMPRLNGFGLTTAIRADRKLAELPVILVTALASRDDRERGIDVGANAYLVKSDFDQNNLLEAVRRFV
jgi:two-component system, chemotaxis family, sensor kinase CheA